MGSSARKKAAKRADFQKAKLKVGKARAKPNNFTDTSFKSKAISIAAQSIAVAARSPTEQLSHDLSLLSSRSDTQRRESLAHLSHLISSVPSSSPLPQPLSVLLPKLSPLLLDGSTSVRTQLLKVLRQLPGHGNDDISPHVEKLLLYIRAGMTHISVPIRATAVEALTWILDTAGSEVVGCAGGWIKTLKTLCITLHWPVENLAETKPGPTLSASKSNTGGGSSIGWTQSHNPTLLSNSLPLPSLLTLLAHFLSTGLSQPPSETLPVINLLRHPFPYHSTAAHMLPTCSNAYGWLNLFGHPRDAEGEMYDVVGERRSVFRRLGYETLILKGVEGMRKEGGDVGRGAARVNNIIGISMKDVEAEEDEYEFDF